MIKAVIVIKEAEVMQETQQEAPFDKESWYLKKMPEQITSIEELFGTLLSDINSEDIRAERLSK